MKRAIATVRRSLALALLTLGVCIGCGERPAEAQPVSAPPQPGSAAPVRSGPVPLDAAMVQRAEDLAAQYQAGARPEPEDEHNLAQAEQQILLTEAMLDAGKAMLAGQPWTQAAKLLREIPASRRQALGERFRTCDQRVTVAGRRLLAATGQ